MKTRRNFIRALSVTVVVGLCALGLAPGARAQGAVDPDAQGVLTAMSRHLGSLQRFSVEYAAVDEVITQEGQKLQFLHSGTITVQRPDRLHAVRRGAAGTAEIILTGAELTLFNREANAYLQVPATSIAAAIDVVRGLGFDAPGADLLEPAPLDGATVDITSGAHIGMTFIGGVEVHHLAFRGAEVDWQLWVTVGDRPLPLRYVINSKTVDGAPQYMLELRNWNAAPETDAARFTFVPPQGARRLDPASVTANAVGDMVIRPQ